MGYTLEQLATDIRQPLEARPAAEGRTQLCRLVEKALTDETFLAETLGPERTRPREVLYEDADLGFGICAHVYRAGAASPPHDHGHAWAIYGQAEGVTEMTDWRIVEQAQDDKPARVAPERVYELTPGMACFYEIGAVHSPKRAGATKLLRVEGANLDRVQRSPIEPIESEAA